MKGLYLLLLRLDKSQQIYVGRLGRRLFLKGFYAYAGSALNGLESRVNRHLSDDKKLFWHIDYLLEKASVYEVILIPTEEKLECILAAALEKRLVCIRHFGSSDCKCPGHLFYAAEKKELDRQVTVALASLGPVFYRYPAKEFRAGKTILTQ